MLGMFIPVSSRSRAIKAALGSFWIRLLLSCVCVCVCVCVYSMV